MLLHLALTAHIDMNYNYNYRCRVCTVGEENDFCVLLPIGHLTSLTNPSLTTPVFRPTKGEIKTERVRYLSLGRVRYKLENIDVVLFFPHSSFLGSHF